ncbi:hypothetical protein AMTR_s00008p00256230 [Amborella trichopoda]|uniref:Uncharacterized protein n=1 Tax=Amborella trichopoda TaxID=13333 RepID=W1NI35_AMBTC|nr:hypothetical protein AMTR_s00008p00256230 [Amborella trichopoda]
MAISDPGLSGRGASLKTPVSSGETLALTVRDPTPEVTPLGVLGTVAITSSYQDDKDMMLRVMLHSGLELLEEFLQSALP